MSIWNKTLGTGSNMSAADRNNSLMTKKRRDSSNYAIIDIEVGINDRKIHDIGVLRHDDAVFHDVSKEKALKFIKHVDYICGHNIINHDAKYMFGDSNCNAVIVDTLFISPLIFPDRPYHRLLKDDKLISDEINNPVNDCFKAKDLLFDEIAGWKSLPEEKRLIFSSLLMNQHGFEGFLNMVNAGSVESNPEELISRYYHGKICSNVNLEDLIQKYPCELAYSLALIDTSDYRSITPSWVLHNFPQTESVMEFLRNKRCSSGCEYCNKQLDVRHNLKQIFGFDSFRTYEGEPLQEMASQAAVDGKSLLAIFPTGGGKSLTFQLPALMAGHSLHGITVVISPLQSLMKDQVDNLTEKGITEAATINGLIDPINRAHTIQRVSDGGVSILYISPEMLRSRTIEKILLSRNVVRFVIDEAHCFSSWGQDFRVDYLYIGTFIKKYQQQKLNGKPICVSCFTATAKPKVIQDIRDYFERTLGLRLEIFASKASRTNLKYSVIHTENDESKYQVLRRLVSESACPTIVYVSRTKRTREIAARLTRDGFKALPFNGKMDSEEKMSNQDAFMNDEVNIIVATSAFGMGVDKSDVGTVIHYDISDSLENYVQEAGRAGRNPGINANCYVLYSDNDLDKHFILLNQTKLSLSEIQQVWKAVKDFTKQRMRVCCSALEIARQAGWDDSVSDIETRVRIALATLEQSGYIVRGNNVPHVYATGLTVKNMDEARKRISSSIMFESSEIEKAIRIIKSLISQKNIAKAQDSEAESRIDYLADILGLTKRDVISVVNRMKQEGILADTKDISAYLVDAGNTERKSHMLLDRFAKLERYILSLITEESLHTSCKLLNEQAAKRGLDMSKEKDIRTLLYFLSIMGYTRKHEDASHSIVLNRLSDLETLIKRFEKRLNICRFAVEWLYDRVNSQNEQGNNSIQFSVIELLKNIQESPGSLFSDNVRLEDVEEALLYLSKIGALKLEGGFLVLYNAMDIRRLKDNKSRYKQEDYRILNEFYKQKIQQIHIVGEYANLMAKDYNAALQYVQDYFTLDYRKFIAKYFKGERSDDIERNITPAKYRQLFGQLSRIQSEIISDKNSRCIVVAAGPGSGKTRVLVHKLASLLILEDVKHEQLLMLTFSRAAATEFKQRLMKLIGNAAHFVEIKTFHSYCFDLLGRIGNLDDAQNVVADAARMINNGDVEPSRIGKTVLVIDEAQDMSSDEFELVKALMANNDSMRVIAVGDDDQNIYEFRGSNSEYMYRLSKENGSRFIEMTENYRSGQNPVAFAENFVKRIRSRIKTKPIISMRKESGWVKVTKHRSEFMFEPIVDDVLNGLDRKNVGTTCVLTQTNDEAAIINAQLLKYGVDSKLIQSLDGFPFRNLAEMKYFIKIIDTNLTSSLITEKAWEEAKTKTFSKYSRSRNLSSIKRCIELFENTNRTKYYTDLKEFIFESSLEDFCDSGSSSVIVSTIHKAKGREFDNVYMLLSDRYDNDDVLFRRLYVGMTRARNYLSIHTNSDIFESTNVNEYTSDIQIYPLPEEIVIQLSLKDVYLNFFKERKLDIISLQAGDSLTYDNFSFYAPNDKVVARMSSKMQKTVTAWQQQGYFVKSSSVNYIVSWREKDAPAGSPLHAVLLPELTLTRKQ